MPKRPAPLGPAAPGWARRLYRRSVRVLIALTDPRSGALIAGEREGWDYVWPRDAAAGALALEAAGLRPDARRVVALPQLAWISATELGSIPTVPRCRGVARLGTGRAGSRRRQGPAREIRPCGLIAVRRPQIRTVPSIWRDRQDYGENVGGDLLGNAIAAGAPASEIASRFGTPRGLVREHGDDKLDSAAAWAVTVFPGRGLRGAARKTLLELTRESTRYGIPPIEGWTPGQVWTAPTAWSAWALVELGETGAADRLLAELRRAATRYGTLPERLDARTGRPTSTTPLAWSHAFAILALRARYPGR